MDENLSGESRATVTDSVESSTWRCVNYSPEGPFDDGEIMWHFEMQLLETGERFFVSVSGPSRTVGANFARAMVGTAGIVAAAVGATMPGVSVDHSKPN